MAYEVAINEGVGDVIVSRSMLMSLNDPKIKVALNYDVLRFKGGECYRGFITEFSKIVFSGDDRFEFDPMTREYPKKTWADFWNDGLRPQYLDLSSVLCSGESLGCGPYVCLHTKVRGFPYSEIREQYLRVLEDSSKKYKLVLIGEREIELNDEYKLPEVKVSSIYEDLKGLGNVMDLTIPKLGLTSPTIGQVRQDCKYMNEAKVNIVIGVAGNLSLSGCVGKKTINICHIPHLFAPTYGARAACVTRPQEFIEEIEEI